MQRRLAGAAPAGRLPALLCGEMLTVIVLLTDFGTRDPYVASMKGVIASRCAASIHDLTHEIAPFDVWEAAWFLRTVAPWWPEETIFVCVVDPGVGSARRIVAAEERGRIFLAPDNGLLTFMQPQKVVSVVNEALFLPTGSTTFHGRDRFAPVAAALSNGTVLDDLGPAVTDLVRLEYAAPQYGDVTSGTIVHIDRFGNCITDIEKARLSAERGDLRATVNGRTIDRVATTYSGDGPFLIVGSSGMIEISMSNASAADVLQLRRGDRVEID